MIKYNTTARKMCVFLIIIIIEPNKIKVVIRLYMFMNEHKTIIRRWGLPLFTNVHASKNQNAIDLNSNSIEPRNTSQFVHFLARWLWRTNHNWIAKLSTASPSWPHPLPSFRSASSEFKSKWCWHEMMRKACESVVNIA